MSIEKPVHVPREKYPELTYPKVIVPETVSPEMGGPEDGVHLMDYWRVIVARRWTIMAVLFTAVAITLIWTFKQTPIYQAQVSIQIDPENPNVLNFKDIYQIDNSTDDTLRTQFEVLKSRSVARRVIQDQHLDRNEELRAAPPGVTGTYLDALRKLFLPTSTEDKDKKLDPLAPIIDEYLDRLLVNPVRQARLVIVSFESKDPQFAAKVINAHADAFIEQNFQYKWEATQKASDFLKGQLATLRANLENAEDRLQAYSRDNQILFTEQGRNTATEKLQQLEEEYTKAQADRFQKESYDHLIRAGNTAALPQFISNQLIASLGTQLAQAQREESELAVTFSPDYPSRKRKRSQIEEIEKSIAAEKIRIIETIQSEHAASVEREALLSHALEQQRDVVNRINLDIIQYNIIKREVDSSKQLYEGLLTRLNEAGVSADLRASNIRVVDKAEVPEKPLRPRKALNLALSLLAGLVGGVGLAFFQEYMDDTIKGVEDVSRYLNSPTLGLVPKMSSLMGRRGYRGGYFYGQGPKKAEAVLSSTQPRVDIVAHEAPSSLMAEAYRSIRTSLLLSAPDRPPKSVLVTSSSPSEGKTVTAVNVAISLTQTGARVVLVDADMRKPRVHSVFDLQGSVGLSAVLTGTATLKSAIHTSSIPNLFILPCGPIPPNPGELIVAKRFREVVEVLSQYFDYIILDSPPISNVSDGRILASLCDATILVVKAVSTSHHHGRSAVRYLQESHARIAGVVLNDIDVRATGSYYSYYYSKYSYSYSAEPPSGSA